MRRSLVMVCSTLAACVDVREGSGDVVTEVRELGAFSGVIADHPFDVVVVPGPRHEVAVRCDDNLLSAVLTSVERGDLIVHSAAPARLRPTVDCLVFVTAPDLERAAATGSGALYLDGREAEGGFSRLRSLIGNGSGNVRVDGGVVVAEFQLGASGSGSVEVDHLSSTSAILLATGSGRVAVDAGDTVDLDVESTGGGAVATPRLQAANVSVRSSGSGKIAVYASDSFVADLSGSGDVEVWGAPPSRDEQVTGSGRIFYLENY